MNNIEGFVKNVAIMLKMEAAGLSKTSDSDIIWSYEMYS